MLCSYCQQQQRETEQRIREEMERQRKREEQQKKCDESQQQADAICRSGMNGDIGRFNGGEALSHGLTCLTQQKLADKACKK